MRPLQRSSRDGRRRRGLNAPLPAQDRRRQLDYYALLGVSPSASATEIKRAWRRAASAFHPDKFQNLDARAAAAERFTACNEAHRVLADPARRRAYDLARGGTYAGIGHHTRSRVVTVHVAVDLTELLRASGPGRALARALRDGVPPEVRT